MCACLLGKEERKEGGRRVQEERAPIDVDKLPGPAWSRRSRPSFQLMRGSGSDVPTPDGEGRTARSFIVRFRWAAPDDGGRSQDRPTKMTPGGEHIIRNTSDASVPKGQCRYAKDARQRKQATEENTRERAHARALGSVLLRLLLLCGLDLGRRLGDLLVKLSTYRGDAVFVDELPLEQRLDKPVKVGVD